MKIFLFFFWKAIKVAGSVHKKIGSVRFNLAETQVFFLGLMILIFRRTVSGRDEH